MPIQPVDKIWMDGKLLDWEDATVHVLTHALHYGSGAFEVMLFAVPILILALLAARYRMRRQRNQVRKR